MATRLLHVDPYGSSSTLFLAEATPAKTASRFSPPFSLSLSPAGETTTPMDIQDQPPPPYLCVERTLENPSWEALGTLLVDIRDSIRGSSRRGYRYEGSPAVGPQCATVRRKNNGDEVGGAVSHVGIGADVDDEGSSGAVEEPSRLSKAAKEEEGKQAAMTLSTPVRIILRQLGDSAAVGGSGHANTNGDTTTSQGSESTPAAAPAPSGDSRRDESRADAVPQRPQPQQQPLQAVRRHRRRPSVERAMNYYSDGSSSSSEDDENNGCQTARGKSGGRGAGGRKGSGWRGGERRKSARQQRQDEIREADVAAARENDMQV